MAGMEVFLGNERIDGKFKLHLDRIADADLDAYEEVVRKSRDLEIPILYDIDDLLIDLPEDHPDTARYIPGRFPVLRAITEADAVTVASETLKSHLQDFNPNIHVLPNYLLDDVWGKIQLPHTDEIEEDEPNPLNVYGASKLAGDEAILGSGCAHLILRTSWVYGARGKNFYLTMLRLAREREEIRVVDDQIGSPTWCRSIAQVTCEILKQGFQAEGDRIGWDEEIPSGVYNYSSSGSTSWYGFAEEILRTDPDSDEHVVKTLVPISTEVFGAVATRPYTLSSQRIS
jgi:dTDP-4-dehydrorhamnose reductase